MQANTDRRHDPTWPAVRQRLLANGSLTRYRFSIPQPVAKSQSTAVALKRPDLRRAKDERPQVKEEVDVITSQRARAFPLPLLLTRKHIGGLRGDPFNMYPVESKGCVQSSLDYCEITSSFDPM